MEQKCVECGMVGSHKLSCSQQYKSRDSLKENWDRLKEISYYNHLDQIVGKVQ